VDNNYLDLGMSKSGFIHALPSGRLTLAQPNPARDRGTKAVRMDVRCAGGWLSLGIALAI
jgi:hypothetical protein